MQCDKCSRHAVIFQPYSGMHLCREHLVRDVERKAKHAIRVHGWVGGDDHIAVALSGDQSSSALLVFLKKLTALRHDITLSAITIDEGIANFRDPAGAARIAASCGISHITASFADAYGLTMDTLVRDKGISRACLYCRVLRESLLNHLAQEHGISKLALGITLDDHARSVLMCILDGTPERLVKSRSLPDRAVPHISPFKVIPEREAGLYAYFHGTDSTQYHCPYGNNTLEEDLKTSLDSYTSLHPSAAYSVARLGERLLRTGELGGDGIRTCPRCGEPIRDTCWRCRILAEVTGSGT